ncbi:MAG TPA: hypothetical protein VFW73_07685, partial [Lacipirellulaceae bacterium]|nr:hypothetical protein [Lacipirellulaceae bacterium]
AAANDAHRSLAQAGDDWQRRFAEVENRCTQQSTRIIELERQLTEKVQAAKPPEPKAVPIGAAWHESSNDPIPQDAENVAQGRQFADLSDQASSGPGNVTAAAEYEWPYLGNESDGKGFANETHSDDGATCNGQSSTSEEVRSGYISGPLNGVAADDWQAAASTNGELSLPQLSDNETTSAADSSCGTQVALSPEQELSSGAATELNAADENGALEATETAKRAEPTSFIERYSHLFQDGESVHEEQPRQNMQGRSIEHDKPRESDLMHSCVPASPERSDDEESVEQYMAKLLQRVRGEATNRNATVAELLESSEKTPGAASEVAQKQSTATSDSALPRDAYDVHANTPEGQPFTNGKPLHRKAAAQIPATDLGALRALANETARRAIGRHDVRKQRQDAVKKLIISMATGVASGWLMFTSRNWQSLQFISGGVFLLVASFWVGQTFRALLGSVRAATYDGPELDGDAPLSEDEAGLPIDIEGRA